MKKERFDSAVAQQTSSRASAGFSRRLSRARDEAIENADRNEDAPAPLPVCLRAVRISGGEATVGHVVAGELIAPSFIESVGDLVVEPIERKPSHACIDAFTLEQIMAVVPRRPALTFQNDADVIPELIQEAEKLVHAYRDLANSDVRWRDIFGSAHFVSVAVDAVLRTLVQDFRLSPNAAASAFIRAWKAAAITEGNRETGARPYALRLKISAHVPRLGGKNDLATYVERAKTFASPSEFVLAGTRHASIVAQHEAARKAEAEANAIQRDEASRLAALAKTTPSEAGLIVMRRYVGMTRALPINVHDPARSVRDGFDVRTFVRTWPSDVPIVQMHVEDKDLMDGGSVAWEICGDDDAIELSIAEIERGARRTAPRFVLDGLRDRVRAKLSVAPSAITSFVDLRDPQECKRRTKMLRELVDAWRVPLFEHVDTNHVAAVRGLLLNYAVTRLRLDPIVIADVVNRVAGTRAWSPTMNLASDAYSIANAPELHCFEPLAPKE